MTSYASWLDEQTGHPDQWVSWTAQLWKDQAGTRPKVHTVAGVRKHLLTLPPVPGQTGADWLAAVERGVNASGEAYAAAKANLKAAVTSGSAAGVPAELTERLDRMEGVITGQLGEIKEALAIIAAAWLGEQAPSGVLATYDAAGELVDESLQMQPGSGPDLGDEEHAHELGMAQAGYVQPVSGAHPATRAQEAANGELPGFDAITPGAAAAWQAPDQGEQQ